MDKYGAEQGGGQLYLIDPGVFVEEIDAWCFDPSRKPGDYAIVETVRGVELGKVIVGNKEIDEKQFETELKDVLRKANQEDLIIEEKNNKEAEAAFKIFKHEVVKLDLDMKPLQAEYTFDRTKIIFYYTADDRVDFRDLLKHLTPQFKLRVELRQIGTREGARLIGGLGGCGREICCRSFLKNFDVVTMKMAKDQSMSLNNNKISGICGKLMCCIAYESGLYQELREIVPAVGTYVKTPNCDYCKVVGVDYVKQIIRAQESPDGMPVAYYAEQVQVVPRKDK
jgi:cell fate regulator YaaT (PSP1 superfamily)